MPTDVIMPQMGESIFEGTITKWLKQPGEKVQRDEPLFEISTDKVDAEIPAPASGTLQDIKVQAGATVQVNTVVGTIAEEGAAARSSLRRQFLRRQNPRLAGTEAVGQRRRARNLRGAKIRRPFQAIFPRARRLVWSGNSKARSKKILQLASRTVFAPVRWSVAWPRTITLT